MLQFQYIYLLLRDVVEYISYDNFFYTMLRCITHDTKFLIFVQNASEFSFIILIVCYIPGIDINHASQPRSKEYF